MARNVSRISRRVRRAPSVGVVCINASFNNTIVSITTVSGDVIAWSSSGAHGFKGSKKSMPYAAQVVTESAAKKAYEMGVKSVSVKVKGPGLGRESALRALQSVGLVITSIQDTTPMPHNGCRPKKQRRV